METVGRRSVSAALALLVVVAGSGLGAVAGAADDAQPCPPPGGEPAYTVALRALTGPKGGDLALTVDRAQQSGCTIPETLKKVQLKLFALDGTLAWTRNLSAVAANGGETDLALGAVERGQRVEVELLVQTGDSVRTYVLRGVTTVRLRPDLVVRAVTVPRVVYATRPFTVTARVAEVNGDTGATASLLLAQGSTTIGTAPITVDAGGSVEVRFADIAIADPGLGELTVRVEGAAPGETDAANNERRAPIDAINVAALSENVLVPSLGGYGAQMNQNVYAAITGAPLSAFGDLESKVIAQHPGIVRVFYNDAQVKRFPDQLQSFFKTLQLAQRAGATINVSWQSGGIATPDTSMTRFASVLETAVRTWGITSLRWVTVQNEPNSTNLTPPQIEANYRALDIKLTALGLRDQIRFMGLDLVADNQRLWFEYAAAHMNDLLDAYSIHVFWDYWDTPKLEQRLNDVRAIVDALPSGARKPLYVMEYGVRGIREIGTTKFIQPGVWDLVQQIPVTQTNVNAFQQAWFDIESAQLGYAGTVKWDSYFSNYDNTPQAFFMLGQWDENGIWPVNPIYNVVSLFTATTRSGWNVTGVEADTPLDPRVAAAYAGPNGELTIVGLDRDGGQLNGLSTTLVPYAVGGLPPSTTFHLFEWNRDGDGRNVDAGTITTDDAGVANLEVPLQAAFALTTLPSQL
jgi:hypothetical protein